MFLYKDNKASEKFKVHVSRALDKIKKFTMSSSTVRMPFNMSFDLSFELLHNFADMHVREIM